MYFPLVKKNGPVLKNLTPMNSIYLKNLWYFMNKYSLFANNNYGKNLFVKWSLKRSSDGHGINSFPDSIWRKRTENPSVFKLVMSFYE